jgi:hypothetical protein
MESEALLQTWDLLVEDFPIRKTLPLSLSPLYGIQTGNTVLYVTLGILMCILANTTINVFSMGYVPLDMRVSFLSLVSEILLEPTVNSSFN